MSGDDDDTTESGRAHVASHELHHETGEQALARAERYFGAPEVWASPLMHYRWKSDFQADWKQEVGHYLHTAERHGYLGPLVERVVKRAHRRTSAADVDANDRNHLVFNQEIAPALVAHYLIGTGWGFVEWEPPGPDDEDVDIRLRAPSGVEVDLQVKAPDTPGNVVNHRIVDGERDERIIAALEKAALQLPRNSHRPTLIAVHAQRRWLLAHHPKCVVVHTMGSTSSANGGPISMWESNLGRFFNDEWAHVSGVVLIDYARSDEFFYVSTVLLNPTAPVRCDPAWFPRARVCILDQDDIFRWLGGEPGERWTLRDGTPLVRGL